MSDTIASTETGAPPARVWQRLTGMPSGLFRGTRTFTLSPTDAGTRFEMSERFTGPLSGMIVRSMPDLTPSFERWCADLERVAESAA